jgi:hypothetical protein
VYISLSLDRFVQILGAVAPVVAVSGVIAVSKIVDPPETPKEYIEKAELAEIACRSAVDYLLTSLYEAKNANEMFLANRISKDELSRVIARAAESIDLDMKNFYKRLTGMPPEVANAVKKTFSPELINYMVSNLKAVAEFVRTYHSDAEIYRTTNLEIKGGINAVIHLYCKCLCEAGIDICKR